ncbi:tetratricopeptide repeat protein [Rhodobacterales bacterium HKCCE2091]|nr:tetratricopeptide repeat protein [Rhodobacterales bacterium HKCCE2091]
MRLQTVGAFRLVDASGIDRTPRAAKARAVLAMLVSVPERRRARRWLESRLWSDRGPEQAAGSLRQALMQIRRALGPESHRLGADRESVWIGGIETDTEADAEAQAQGRDFLEGFDIMDPAFEDWLRQERAIRGGVELRHRTETTSAVSAPGMLLSGSGGALPLILAPGMDAATPAGFLGHAIADAIGGLVSEFAAVEIFAAGENGTEITLPERGFTIAVHCLPAPGQSHVRVALSDSQSGKVYWSRGMMLSGDAAESLTSDEFPQIVFQAADAAVDAAARLPRQQGAEMVWVDARMAQAMRAMFTFDRTRVAEADKILSEVIDAAPNSRAYAWRAQLCQIAAVERTGGDWQRLADEADEYARRAMEFGDSNPLVLALVSQIRVMLDGDPELGTALAEGALAASPHNAFSHAAISGAHLRAGRLEEALASARTGARIAARSSFQPWWQALAGLAAMALGRYDEAGSHYQAAYARAPAFRAPMRHLYVLHRAAGRHAQAERTLAMLRRLEPDFSLLRVRDDPAYPAATLRRSPLIGKALATAAE